jgi:hypothetical protein
MGRILRGNRRAKVLVDPKLQWSQAKNVWQNAGVRSMLYAMIATLRRTPKHDRTIASRTQVGPNRRSKTMREIHLSAGTIEYEDSGGDGPILVLLHGLA